MVARRRFGAIGARALGASLARTALASVPLALWCVLAAWMMQRPLPMVTAACGLAVAVGGGAALFAVASRLTRAPERTVVFDLLARRR